MTKTEVANIANAIGIPWCYDHFIEDPDPPYLVYYYPSENDFVADGENYVNIRSLTFELFTKKVDFDLEEDFEDELKAAGIVWVKSTDYLDDEKLYQITYETEVIINGEQS